MLKTHYGDKLAGHVSRAAGAIHAREKAARKPQKEPKPPQKRGRRPQDQPPPPDPTPTRLQRQLHRDRPANLADRPTACDWGGKKNSQSQKESWRGYPLHMDTIDGDIPVSAILTSASPHDSQVAIPLAQMTAARVTSRYDLADAAYDAKEIRERSARLGHVAISDDNPGRGEKREFSIDIGRPSRAFPVPGSVAGCPAAPPQSRTSVIDASGSSGHGFATRTE
jgi:hypothetical protein